MYSSLFINTAYANEQDNFRSTLTVPYRKTIVNGDFWNEQKVVPKYFKVLS